MGLPYVYAVYAVNEGVKLGENLNALEMSRSLGLKMVEKISKIESERVKLSEGICLRYLTERIKYDLGEKEVKAILTHADFLTRLGELKKVPEVRIYSEWG